MIKYAVIGAIAGTLFFSLWSLCKTLSGNTPENIVYALPLILVFAAGAVAAYLTRNRQSSL